MIGHLLGASGGVELIATVLSIRHSVVHPTINYQTPDPSCDLDYVPNTPREMRVRRALSNSFGFGGHNCSLVVGAPG
jgi:3-oxoacyl-[acyl-carrier-protein] synthase II